MPDFSSPRDRNFDFVRTAIPALVITIYHLFRHWLDFTALSNRNPHAGLRSPVKHKEYTNMKPKNTICLWFDKDAHEAARFYAATFPDSKVTAVHKAPGDYPGGKQGDVLTVEFTVLGIPCLGLNGGPQFKHSEAFSFQIATENQEETDRYWNAIVGNGGKESQCGWCKDRWGLSWQITPRALTEALAAGGGEAKRAFEAMMPMKKRSPRSRQRGEATGVEEMRAHERPRRDGVDLFWRPAGVNMNRIGNDNPI